MEKNIIVFTDLEVWKEGHKLVLITYKIINNFPDIEKFGLSIQLRRAIVSITSNIAEGFARPTYKEKLRFYYIALGSLIESQNQLLIARDLNYIDKDNFNMITAQSVLVHKMLNAFIKKTKSYI